MARTLLIEGPAQLRVIFVDDADEVGRGLAYRTGNLSHLLNVPAGRLGIDPDDEAAFGRWLSSMALRHRSSDFVPRHLLGRYVAAELDAASSRAGCSWQILNGHARDIRRGSESRFDVALSDGRFLSADSVVIATGHPKPLLPPLSGNVSWHDDDMVSDPCEADDRDQQAEIGHEAPGIEHGLARTVCVLHGVEAHQDVRQAGGAEHQRQRERNGGMAEFIKRGVRRIDEAGEPRGRCSPNPRMLIYEEGLQRL